MDDGVPDAIDFWERLSRIDALLERNDGATRTVLQDCIAEVMKHLQTVPDAQAHLHRDLLTRVLESKGIEPRPAPGAMLSRRLSEAATPPLPGVSVVTASMNRTENLLPALGSWLDRPEVREVVIVDWSSRKPVAASLAEADVSDPRMRVLRVEGEPRWILSKAFNLGFLAASRERIVKADADIVLSEDFFAVNDLREGEVIAGNWRTAAAGQEHINGFFYTTRAILEEINGFNEYIDTYGWDDDDLYRRMSLRGTRRKDVGLGTVHHLPHDDRSRMSKWTSAATPVAFREIEAIPSHSIKRNAVLSAVFPEWNGTCLLSPFRVLSEGDELRLERTDRNTRPVHRELSDLVDLLAGYELLSWRIGKDVYKVAPRILRTALATRRFDEISLDDLEGMTSTSPASPLVAPERATRLFVDAQHGLGNRMRAIASGATVARALDMELVVVWQPDDHCDCRFADLFDYAGPVEDAALMDAAARDGAQIVDLMQVPPEERDARRLRIFGGQDVYVRSAFALNSGLTNWAAENHFLQALRPRSEILSLVASVRSPNDLSVHVRMVGGTAHEHLPFEARGNWSDEDHAKIDKWRRLSGYERFIRRIEALEDEAEIGSIFVAADNPDAYLAFEERFGTRVAFLEREVYDRSKEQLMYALADAILLGRAPRLLGSTWSSFTELAARLAPQKLEMELSGRDF